MSQNQPYDPEQNPSTPPSGVPDPTVHGPNPQAAQSYPTGATQDERIDDFYPDRDRVNDRPAEPYVAPANIPSHPVRTDRGGAWIWGLFLIALGAIFLFENFGLFRLENWWALFIMLPAIGSFRQAFAMYRSSGNRLTSAARGPLLGGAILTTISMIFLFGLDFGEMWPLLLVIAGAALLVNALLPN